MGYNTGILILNDQFGEIVRQPKAFVESNTPFVNCGRLPDHSDGYLSRFGTLCFHSGHMSEFPAYILGGNNAVRLTRRCQLAHSYVAEDDLRLEQLRILADELGYRLVAKTKKK